MHITKLISDAKMEILEREMIEFISNESMLRMQIKWLSRNMTRVFGLLPDTLPETDSDPSLVFEGDNISLASFPTIIAAADGTQGAGL
jgi:hypothetical protein